jgi:hypothetical protein
VALLIVSVLPSEVGKLEYLDKLIDLSDRSLKISRAPLTAEDSITPKVLFISANIRLIPSKISLRSDHFLVISDSI